MFRSSRPLSISLRCSGARPLHAECISTFGARPLRAARKEPSWVPRRLAAGFDFAGEPAGRELGPDRVAVRARETSCYVGGTEALDYQAVLVERDGASKTARDAPGVGELPAPGVKCALVLGGVSYAEAPSSSGPESARPFDETPLAGATSHVYLSRALGPAASSEAFDRVNASPLSFQQAIEELLLLTRPFSFYA